MGFGASFLGTSALLLSTLLTAAVRRVATVRGFLDIPNARSSHAVATPRGGGIAVVLVVGIASVALAARGEISRSLLYALLGGGSAVAAIGLLDDRRGVAAGVRLMVHICAAAWGLWWIGVPVTVAVDGYLVHLGLARYLVAVIAVVWSINLFNFMDGIDGIAASEAAFIAAAGAVLGYMRGGPADVELICVTLAAACCGFLVWNWPPAKIFMGDVGSGYLGFILALLAFHASGNDSTTFWAWLILGSLFVVDATLTLLRRAIRGERIHQAHRSHAYQSLARRWESHGRVTLVVLTINVFWLFPCAFLASVDRSRASWLALAAAIPLVVAAGAAGAGKLE